MASNAELEIQLRAAKKDIQELRDEVEKLKSASAAAVSAELATLRKILDKAFSSAGLGINWCQANAVNAPTASEVAAQMYEDKAPQPQSALPTAQEWKAILGGIAAENRIAQG